MNILFYGLNTVEFLYYGLNAEEFNRTATNKNVKDIWRNIEVKHEGITQVKESKITLLVHQFELFKMHDRETTFDLFMRFTNILNGLKYLGWDI